MVRIDENYKEVMNTDKTSKKSVSFRETIEHQLIDPNSPEEIFTLNEKSFHGEIIEVEAEQGSDSQMVSELLPPVNH